IRLKLVVLPAPLGPISATVSPSRTEKLRSWTARSPPNRLLRLRITSASAIERHFFCAPRAGIGKALVQISEKPNQSGWPPQDDGNQDQAVTGQLHAAMPAAEPALQQRGSRLQQNSSDDRTPQCADAAHDRHQRGIDRNIEAERGIRIDEVDVFDVERASERGQECADQVDMALDLRRIH